MNQQAFYRNAAIGEFQLDANGFLAYLSWGQRTMTVQVMQYRNNQRISKLVHLIVPMSIKLFDSARIERLIGK